MRPIGLSVRSMFQTLADWYLRPREFEAGRLYPLLGVRWYKKAVPSSGEWVSRWRGIDRLKIAASGSRRLALQNYDLQARKWEIRHLVSAIPLQVWAVVGGATVGVEQFWTCSAINVVVNIYPIMVQRFNRARIALLLQQQSRPNPAVEGTGLRQAP